jgi:hypothetical protein
LSGVGRPRAGDVAFERPAQACAGIASDVVGAAYVFFVAAAIVSVVGYRRTSPTPELGSEITVAAVAVGGPSTELGPVGPERRWPRTTEASARCRSYVARSAAVAP